MVPGRGRGGVRRSSSADADADGVREVAAEAEADVGADADADADGGVDADADGDVGVESDADPGLLPPLDAVAEAALASATYLIVVVTPTWSDDAAELALFTRGGGGWELSLGPWPAEVGYSGLSWGRGLTQPPPGATNVKEEGDGSAPAGIFRLGPVMGYDADPPAGLLLPYRTSAATTICIDDPASSHYNKIVESTDVVRDYGSHENMRRTDELYSLLAPIDHNGLLEGESPIPGGGSCIFLHLWSGAGSPTVGCTSLEGSRLLDLLRAPDRLDDLLFVQLPQAEYGAAVDLWGLPQFSG